jgi:hypothetical protein
MKIFEIESRNNFNSLLIEFWKTSTPEQMKYYFVQDNCYGASQDFNEFLESKRIMNGEIIPIGRMISGKKTKGWIKVDVPDTSLDAFTKEDITKARAQGLDPRKKQDRVLYITNNNLQEEFTWIPHSWVEIRGEILDPSGFYLDGKSGQFDRMIKDKSNLKSRYHYFP